MAKQNVAFKRKELEAKLPEYEVIRDAVAGSVAVKAKGRDYLPTPNPGDQSRGNLARYGAYLTRAVFYGVTGRTLRGLSGLIYARDPVLEIPTALQPLVDDTSGEGVSLIQLSKAVATDAISYGRAGLFVDYPETGGNVTKAELEAGNIRPTIVGYSPFQVINWRIRKRGALSMLTLVVIEETYVKQDDGFEIKHGKQWRVLRLSETDIYSVEIWREVAASSYARIKDYIPRDAAGNPLRAIPFYFVGSENNDSEIDPAPLFDLADLNMAHYRNSADHEESLFMSAQATPVITGLTEAWADKYFKNGIPLGARAGISLPVGGKAELIQAEAVSALSEEMGHKERQMVALGAKIVEQRDVQRTATESRNEEATETSLLASIANNVSVAFEQALTAAAQFNGNAEGEIVFRLNSDFSLARMSSADRAQVIKEWQAEALTFSEMRAVLRLSGVATLDDEKALAEIAKTNALLGDDEEDKPEEDEGGAE